MDLLQSRTMSMIESTLDAASLRQKVIANNIANVDTPNFKRTEVQFEELLQSQMRNEGNLVGVRTHENHIPIGLPKNQMPEPQLQTDQMTSMNNNGNNVDIDYEMTLLAKNQLRYNTLVQQMSHELGMIRTAIGRG